MGQYEAAQVLGYSKAQTFVKIILPQVVKRVLPPVTNETITLVKDTSMAFTISIAEMFTVAKQIGAAQTSVVPWRQVYSIISLISLWHPSWNTWRRRHLITDR